MKKTLAILLALAMVFSTLTVAFAEEGTIGADAQACVTLKMLQGEGNGVDAAYLAKTPSRLQAAIMVLRLKGLENEALAYTGTDNFADADQVAWAGGKAIMGYLKTHPELGWVGDQGKFNPNGLMNAKDYYKVMLESLGYKQNTPEVIGDFTYPGVIEFAATKGLAKVATVTNFTNNDVAIATIEALKANVKGAEKTLATSLVEAKILDATVAQTAGVYNPVPAKLAVESVTTDNLDQLVVKFNKEIKAAGDEDNYSVETDGDVVIDENSDYALQADKKTVVITLTHEAAQQEEITLTIDGIEAADGSVLDKTVVENVELFDKTIPQASSAKVIGNDLIKVTFSEPMDPAEVTAEDFEINGGEIIVEDVDLVNNNTEANVKLYSTLEEGTVKVEVGTGVKDFAGFAAPKKAFDVAVVPDTTAPVVVGYEDATPTGVTLIFNEDIKVIDGDVNNFYHTNDSNTANQGTETGDVAGEISATAVDGNKLTLDFSTNTLPEGTAYVYILKDAVSDYWDNENAKISYKLDVTLDTTAPTVTKVEAGTTESELVVTYSEDMDQVTAEDEDNYTILDKDGKEVANVISNASLDKDTVTITFTDDMTGDYSIVIDGVEDEAGNAIVKVTKAFNISDVTAPLFTDFTAKLYNPGTTKQMLKVSFGEAMAITGKYSVLDLEKYEFNNINLADVDNASIKAVDGNKAVEIALPYDSDNTDTHIFAVAQDLVIARVADAASNNTDELASVAGDIPVSGAGTVAIKTDDTDYTARLTAADTIVLTLTDKLTKFTASDFIISSNGVVLTPSRVRHTINDDGFSTVTFTLADDVNTDATTTASGYSIDIDTAATTSSTNVYGEKLATGDNVTIADKAKPVVDTVDYQNATTIVITFSEVLDSNTFASTGKNGFSVSGGTLTKAVLTAPNQVTLTGTDFTENTNVYYNSVFGIKDAHANSMADISYTDKLD